MMDLDGLNSMRNINTVIVTWMRNMNTASLIVLRFTKVLVNLVLIGWFRVDDDSRSLGLWTVKEVYLLLMGLRSCFGQ